MGIPHLRSAEEAKIYLENIKQLYLSGKEPEEIFNTLTKQSPTDIYDIYENSVGEYGV